MYYTGIHPMTGKKVQVTTDYHEKQLQRALLQYSRPENANLVREALKKAGREDLIGNTPECLVRPAFLQGVNKRYEPPKNKAKRSLSASGVRSGAKTSAKSPKKKAVGAKPSVKTAQNTKKSKNTKKFR